MKPRLIALAVFVVGLGSASCRSVEFYEMRSFSDPAMAFDEGGTETHFFQKVFYSDEGSAGGIGTSAGGGCGCY